MSVKRRVTRALLSVMSKIRINELARQLEVPSHIIIDMLPELGVTEKKTHSSSIDEPVAELVRQRVQGSPESSARPEAPTASAVAVAEPEPQQEQHHAPPHAPEQPAIAAKSASPLAAEAPAAPPSDGSSVTTTEEPRKVAPLRPPLSS